MAETTPLGAAIITGNVQPTCASSSASLRDCPPRVLPRHPPSDRCAALCRLSQCGGRDGAEAAAATGYRRPKLLELLLVLSCACGVPNFSRRRSWRGARVCACAQTISLFVRVCA